MRGVPSSLSVDALSGAVDLAATLAAGAACPCKRAAWRPIRCLLVRRAERLDAACTSLMAQALDRDELLLIASIDPYDEDAALAPKLEDAACRLSLKVMLSRIGLTKGIKHREC